MSSNSDDNQSGAPPTPESHHGAQPREAPSEVSDDGAVAEESELSDEGAGAEPSVDDEGTAGETGGASELGAADRVQGALEAMFLTHDEPLDRETLGEAFEDVAPDLLDRALGRLKLEYSGRARGIHLEEVAGGFQFRTNPEYHEHLERFVEANPISLSRAAMETLAIVAYRQPLTRAEIEEIRGVNSSGVLRTLDECELIRVVGRLDDLGRPHVYGTTDRFLEFFGLDDLTDLPTLSEGEHEALEELYEEELEKFDEEFDGDDDHDGSQGDDGDRES